MPADAAYHRDRRRNPAVQERRRTYKAAYSRALSRLRDQHRGAFSALLHDELTRARADQLLAAANAGVDDTWWEEP